MKSQTLSSFPSSSMFCPRCGNLLLVERTSGGYDLRWQCQTCPYFFKNPNVSVYSLPLQKKELDDVLGGVEAWQHVDQTEVRCHKCGGDRAYFMQIQIRSADEPMSTFYKCVNCGQQWREG